MLKRAKKLLKFAKKFLAFPPLQLYAHELSTATLHDPLPVPVWAVGGGARVFGGSSRCKSITSVLYSPVQGTGNPHQ